MISEVNEILRVIYIPTAPALRPSGGLFHGYVHCPPSHCSVVLAIVIP